MRRHGRSVIQEPAKLRSPVRLRVVPPGYFRHKKALEIGFFLLSSFRDILIIFFATHHNLLTLNNYIHNNL